MLVLPARETDSTMAEELADAVPCLEIGAEAVRLLSPNVLS